MTDDDIKKRVTWRKDAEKLVAFIQTDYAPSEVLAGTCIILMPATKAAETVLVSVPKDQLKALTRAFPDVKVVEPTPATILAKGSEPSGGRQKPKTPFEIPEIEDFDKVAALIAGGERNKKRGGFGGGGFGEL
jgi:hypothetical protein